MLRPRPNPRFTTSTWCSLPLNFLPFPCKPKAFLFDVQRKWHRKSLQYFGGQRTLGQKLRKECCLTFSICKMDMIQSITFLLCDVPLDFCEPRSAVMRHISDPGSTAGSSTVLNRTWSAFTHSLIHKREPAAASGSPLSSLAFKIQSCVVSYPIPPCEASLRSYLKPPCLIPWLTNASFPD